ncbi:hypothetical protein ACFQVA_02450 [Actinomadura keratinilytica]
MSEATREVEYEQMLLGRHSFLHQRAGRRRTARWNAARTSCSAAWRCRDRCPSVN